MDSVRVGAFIAALRREQGFTQKQLAEKIGVTDKAISRWETGKGYPDVTLLLQLGETLGVTLNELLSGQRLQPETIPAAAQENLTEAYQNVGILRRGNRKRGLLALAASLLAAVLAFCVLQQKRYTRFNFEFDLSTAAAEQAYGQIFETLCAKSVFDRYSVCVDCSVTLNRHGEMQSGDWQFVNSSTRLRCSLAARKNDGSLHCTAVFSPVEQSYPDGLPPVRIFTFLQDCDAVALADDCPRVKSYNAVSVSFSNHLGWYFDEASEVSFGNYQNLYHSGQIEQVTSSAGMSGKYFEAVLTAQPNSQPCCSIYFR